MLSSLINKIISISKKVRIGSKYAMINRAKEVAKRSPLAAKVINHNASLMKGKAATSINFIEAEVTSVSLMPANGTHELAEGETFKLEIGVLGNELGKFELEVDHSLETDFPQFSVYADPADPYGGDESQFEALGVSVSYSAGKFMIDLGEVVTEAMAAKPEVKFYFAVRDAQGKYLWGSMNPPTPENTRTYIIKMEETAPEEDLEEEE